MGWVVYQLITGLQNGSGQNNLWPMHGLHKKPLIMAFVCFDLILIDQITKWAVTEFLFNQGQPRFIWEWLTSAGARIPFQSIEITSFFNIVMVWNQGVSFGLFNHDSPYGAYMLIALSLTITAAFIWWLRQSTHPMQTMGILLVISGAIGNVLDRIRFGAVIDFIDIHIGTHHWPAFNAADSFICIGVALLLIHTLWFEDNSSETEKDNI